MNRQRLVVFVLVVLAAVAGAWALGFWSSASPDVEPARPSAAVAATPDRPVDPKPAVPQPSDTRPSTPAAPRSAVVEPRPPEPEPVAVATLRIDSDVPGAQVFLDNKFIGAAPATVSDVVPGQRKVTVQAPGFDSVSEFYDIAPGPRDLVISLRAIRLDQKVAVNHKHGVGSCSGTLIATPEGVRYVTDNSNDGFTAPLGRLETFEVDYLKNNLRLKVRDGRTYDFSAPSGKPDALYLFHQEVDRVRKRLGGGSW